MHSSKTSSRRRFFWKAGAALSAPLAVGVAPVAAGPSDALATRARVEEIEAVDAMRRLQRELARRVNAGERETLGELFVHGADLSPLEHVRRLVPADIGQDDTVEIARDLQSARVELGVSVDTETAIDVEGTLIEMARAQGEGFIRRTTRSVLELDFVRLGRAWRLQAIGIQRA